MAKASLGELDVLAHEPSKCEQTIADSPGNHNHRFAAHAETIEAEGSQDQTTAYQQTLRALLAAQRQPVPQMRNDSKISNERMNRVQRELPLEASRLEI